MRRVTFVHAICEGFFRFPTPRSRVNVPGFFGLVLRRTFSVRFFHRSFFPPVLMHSLSCCLSQEDNPELSFKPSTLSNPFLSIHFSLIRSFVSLNSRHTSQTQLVHNHLLPFHSTTMKASVVCLVALVARFPVAAAISYAGTYVLKEVEDEVGASVDFPGPTKLTLTGPSAKSSNKYSYSLPLKGGNSLGGSGTINGATGVTNLGPTYSTRMFTPYLQLEALLGTILDSADTTTLNNGVLIVDGPKGSLRLQLQRRRRRRQPQGGGKRLRSRRHS